MKSLRKESNVQIGCYKDCTNCSLSTKCCSCFDRMNSPVLNRKEMEQITKYTHSNPFNKVNANIYHIKTFNNECVFYKNGKCIIYDYRPIDCKLYPYDIIKKIVNII